MLEERGNEMKKETQDLFENETGWKLKFDEEQGLFFSVDKDGYCNYDLEDYYKTLSEWLAEKNDKLRDELHKIRSINHCNHEEIINRLKEQIELLKMAQGKVPIETARKMNKIAFSIGIDTVMNNYEKKQIKIALKAQQEKGYVEVSK